MRRSLWLFVILIPAICWANGLPLTTKDVSLMLRSGYSSATVMKELAQRHFADTFDADKEAALLKVGATPELIEAIKSGSFVVTPQEAAAARAAVAKKGAQADLARSADTAYQNAVARERATRNPMAATVSHNVIAESVKTDVVRFLNGALVREDEGALENKKLIAIYFSAHWCPPCRKFTPQLVDFYNRVAQGHPEFDVLFVSADHSAFAMQDYMREMSMPWPAIAYDKIQTEQQVLKYAGRGIPCLVLVDASGKVLSDSSSVGPQKVLNDIDAILSGSAAPAVAQTH